MFATCHVNKVNQKIKVFGLLLFISLLFGCVVTQRNPVPKQYVDKAQIQKFETVRAYGHKPSAYFQQDLEHSITRYLSIHGNKQGINILSLSGGGSDGAFGAGILNGWSQSGTRPDFYMVTGISTGSLIAPFAFVGSHYDKELKQAFTTISQKDVYENTFITSLLTARDAFTNTKPLAKLIAKYITPEFLAKVAKAHRRGKRLYVGTTNIDYHKLIIWNMGEIATRGSKEALFLFRKILLASAAIPVAFPPVKFPVRVNGEIYDELHVDGGITTEVFLYGLTMDLSKAMNQVPGAKRITKSIYVIRNSKIFQAYKPVKQSLLSIGKKAVLGLTDSQGAGDLFRIYLLAQKDGINYNLLYIPNKYKPSSEEPFDKAEMNKLFDFGVKLGKSGCCWQHYPPLYKSRIL